jgi:hypothetical protein
MADQKVIAPMLVEAGGEHPKNVTHEDVESALMLGRIKNEISPAQKIDGIMRLYFTLKAVPLGGGRFFLVDGISGRVDSFVLGLVNVKVPAVEKTGAGVIEPESIREILKSNVDSFLDFDNYDVLTFHGLIDQYFSRGVQDWAVHATRDVTLTSLSVPDAIRAEDPSNLLKTLKGLENAFEAQIANCEEASSNLRQVRDKIDSRVLDRISAISLSPAMEDQKKKLLERIKDLGDERDRKMSEAEDKIRGVKSSLDDKLRAHLERVEELAQNLRATEAQVRQTSEEEERAALALRTEEARLGSIEDQILATTRKLREIELKKASDTSKEIHDTKSSSSSPSSSSPSSSQDEESTDAPVSSDSPSSSQTSVDVNVSSTSSGQAQVEKLEHKLDGDLLGDDIRQKDRTIEELSLEVAKLNFLLPEVRSRVNELKSTHNSAEAKLKKSKSDMEIAKNSLDEATGEKVLATEQEAALLSAMKDEMAKVSFEYQSKIESILKQVSIIEIGLKEQEYMFHTLGRDINYRIDELSKRLDALVQRNKDTKRRLFEECVIVFPSLDMEPIEIVFPIYIVISRESKTRYKVLFPAYVSKLSSAAIREKLLAKNVKNRVLRRILASGAGNRLIGRLISFSGSSTLSFAEPEGFKAEGERISDLLERDVELSNWLMTILPSTDLLTQNDFFEHVNSGLQKLRNDGTLSKAEVSELRNWALEISAA